ncbi:hypothetical protein ABEW05_010916 [Botrytis cinerea]
MASSSSRTFSRSVVLLFMFLLLIAQTMARENFDARDALIALEEEWENFGEPDMGLSDSSYMSSPKPFKPQSPESYRDFQIELSVPEDTRFFDSLLQFFNQPSSTEYRKAVQTFEITGWSNEYTESVIWPGITNLLLNLPNLSVLDWKISQPIPPGILSNLSVTNPGIRIHLHKLPRMRYSNPWYYKEVSENSTAVANRLQEDVRSLIGSPLLYSINVDIENSYPTDPASMRILFEILRSNPPNLRELQLRLSHFGCVVDNEIEAFPFLSSEFNTDRENMTSIQFPPLEKLVVEGYDFEESPDGGSGWYRNIETPKVDWRTLLKFPWNKLPMWLIDQIGKYRLGSVNAIRYIPIERLPSFDGVSNLDVWLKVMDWSKLKTLHMIESSPVAVQKLGIAGVLTGLKELKIHGMRYPWNYGAKSKWETVVDFLDDITSNGTSLTSLSIREISFPEMITCNDSTTEYKATEKLLDALLRHTNLTKLHMYDGIPFFSWGSDSQLPKQISTLVSVLNSSSIEDLAIDIPSLPGSNYSKSENGNWKTDGIDPKISHEEIYKAFTPLARQPQLKSVEFHVPAPECWWHQVKRVNRQGMYTRSGEVEIIEVDDRKFQDQADMLEVERCEREEEELGKRTRRLFEWMNGEREKIGENAIERLRVVAGIEFLWGKEGVGVEMLGRTSFGWRWRGESGVWSCWTGEEEEATKCEGGRRWREDDIWG